MKGHYQCSLCNEVFQFGWSDEESEAEMKKHFGDVPMEERTIVCDDCYQKIRPDKNPVQYQAWKEKENRKN